MNSSVVVGLGYGDEGKGSMVNFLCKKYYKKPLVVRYSSGHQVGHTVVEGDKRHVFSNFGSGTLSNAPTYWSEYCTVNPSAIRSEGKALAALKVFPTLYINDNAMITTPYDILKNRMVETKNRHGSVGVGFGTTIQRNEDHFKLYARDLRYPKVFEAKLKQISDVYYKETFKEYPADYIEKHIANFKADCKHILHECMFSSSLWEVLEHGYYKHIIFEGNQGIMLDQDFGFFPNVTRGSTTSKNAFELMKSIKMNPSNADVYYITRAYATRHGNGELANEGMPTSYIKDNPLETNVLGEFQGHFRKAPLDLETLKYAMSCDKTFNQNGTSMLAVTCLDQIPERIPIINGDKIDLLYPSQIGSILNISPQNILVSNSDKGLFVNPIEL